MEEKILFNFKTYGTATVIYSEVLVEEWKNKSMEQKRVN